MTKANGRLNFANGFVVVDIGIDADPQFCEMRAVNLVGSFSSTDVRSEIVHSFDGTQFFTGGDGDAVHGFDTDARFLKEMHQEVRFLELRHQLFTQVRHSEAGSDEHQQHKAGNG